MRLCRTTSLTTTTRVEILITFHFAVGLPGTDGLDASRGLGADPATHHLVVIAAAAHVLRGDQASALQAGYAAYLAKPMSTRTLNGSLMELMTSAIPRGTPRKAGKT